MQMVSSRKKKSFWGLKLQGSCEWVDFDGVFLHVKHSSFHVLLVLDVMYDMKLEVMSRQFSYMDKLWNKYICNNMEDLKLKGNETDVCLLKKFLYRLKQSLRQWYKKFVFFLLGHGYSRSNYDNFVYFRKWMCIHLLFVAICC